MKTVTVIIIIIIIIVVIKLSVLRVHARSDGNENRPNNARLLQTEINNLSCHFVLTLGHSKEKQTRNV